MIVAIERSKFIYLYKYNEITIDANQVIDLSEEIIIKIFKENNHKMIVDFNRILPIFEQDHEVILLEIDKNHISIEGKLNICFKAVLSIYPLTNIGNQLLQGKINDNFIINKPIFEDIIEEVKLLRTVENRKLAANNILKLFSLNIDNHKINLIEQALKRILSSKNSTNNFTSYLDYLIAYNKTPNNIPDGNVEFLCKIGVIVLNYLQKDEVNFFKGPFYKSCFDYKNDINAGSIFNSYTNFIEIRDNELITSLEKLKSNIDLKIDNVDIFKASYYFLAYKAFLNKNENNLELLKIEIEQLIFEDELTTAFVLVMIGYTFSFEFLYESLHSLNNAPLIKKSSNNSNLEKASYGAMTDKEKKPKIKITKNAEVVKDEHKSTSVIEEPSIPVLVYESNLNNENISKTVITLFTDDDNSIETNKSIVDDEITKSVSELLSWIDSHKSISKSAATEWKKFIEKYLKYGNHSLIDIFNKVKNENLDKKLTAKMLIDLEKFYTQQ